MKINGMKKTTFGTGRMCNGVMVARSSQTRTDKVEVQQMKILSQPDQDIGASFAELAI
jgi:hypothetical protein